MLKQYFVCIYIHVDLPRNPIVKPSQPLSRDNLDRETFLGTSVDDHIFAR